MHKKLLHSWTARLVWIAIFLLPWQTRWIIGVVSMSNSQNTEYGTISLYGTMILVFLTGLICWLRHHKKKTPNHVRWLMVWIAWLGLAAIWSIMPEVSWYYLLLTIAAIVYYLIVRTVPPIVVASSLVIAGCVQSVMALWQWTVAYIYPNSWLGLAEHDPLDKGQSVIITSAGRILRAYGSLPHPNILAGFLVVSLMALTIWYWLDRRREKPLPTVLFIAGKALMFMGLFVTFSRAGLLALVVSQVVSLGLSLWARRWKLAQIVRSSILLLVLMVIAGNYMTQGLILTRADTSQRLEVISNTERVVSWDEATHLLGLPQLLIGVGPGAYIWAAASYFPGRAAYDYQPTHMAYLLALVEMGLVGLWVLLVVIINCIIWPKRKTEEWIIAVAWVSALATMAVFDHWLWSSYVGLVIIWISVGFITALTTHKRVENV
jgi:hypothetical protein